jgi:hypothetical protein
MYFAPLVKRVTIGVQVIEVVHIIGTVARVDTTSERSAPAAGDLHVVLDVALVEHDPAFGGHEKTVHIAVVAVRYLRRAIGERGHIESDVHGLATRPGILTEPYGDGAEPQ